MNANQIIIRCVLFGLAFVVSLVIVIRFRLPTTQRLDKQHLDRKHLDEQQLLPPWYCTHASIHSNCFFSRSLCYDIHSNQWKTSAVLPSNWTGVSLRSRGSLFRDAASVSICNGLFIPQYHSFPPPETIYWVNGTNVLSCIWVNVFGHIFLEMMLPAWMAMRYLADRLHLDDQNITYILDNRCDCKLASSSFTLLSHQPLLELASLVNQAKISAKSYVCFERLIIGYRLQSSLEYAHNVAHLKVGDLSRYRDAVKKLHGLPLEVNMTRNACVALIVQRTHNRQIVPESEKLIVETLRDRTFCTVQVATFDNIPILEQVRLVANATIFIHVSGSGSHHFIWLPDNAASITIVQPHLGLNVIGSGGIGGGGLMLNEFLCWKHPTILCVTAAAKATSANHQSSVEIDMYSFSNALDMIKLWQNNRGMFDPRDPSE